MSLITSSHPIAQNYIIATSPRTGSELLCEYLSRTEVAGKPGEHFFPKRFPHFYQHYHIHTFPEYAAIIRKERTTPNGVFGTKLIAGDILNEFLEVLRQNASHSVQMTAAQRLSNFFHNLTYIRLTRQDRIRQAISLYRAEATGIWHNTGKQATQPDLPYDYRAIRTRLDRINAIEAEWDAFFEQAQLTPLTITYETFIQTPILVTQQILSHLGLSIPSDWQPDIISNKKMAQTQTDQWVIRYQTQDYPNWD
jgi:LPS sulfotransferase NodH